VTHTGWARFEQQRRLLKPFGAGLEVRHCAIAWPVCPCAHSGTLALWGMAGRTAKPGRRWCRPVGALSDRHSRSTCADRASGICVLIGFVYLRLHGFGDISQSYTLIFGLVSPINTCRDHSIALAEFRFLHQLATMRASCDMTTSTKTPVAANLATMRVYCSTKSRLFTINV
jgi:hypothetical protein